MNDTYTKRAAEILQSIQYATLATVTPDGRPWNSPVARVIDDQANIYWFSDKQGQHSQNVRANNRAFIVVYDSTVAEGNGEGVYIEASITELTDPDEILSVRRIKKGPDYAGTPNEFLGDDNRRVYKATPEKIWINDAEVKNGVFVRDFRVAIDPDELRTYLK